AAAAIVRQYFMEGWYPSGRPVLTDAMSPSAALIRAVLIASGVPVTGSGTVSRGGSDTWPNNEQGFGRVLLSNVLPLAAAGGTFGSTNVEEAVIRKTAMVGDWTVQVIGANVPVGPQPFALVATGNLDASYGRLTLVRVAYSEADTVRLTVHDSSATSVVVHVASGIEPAGEDISLTRGGADEIWRGSIRTAFGTPVTDGILQVREGDTITATYQD